MILSSSFPGLIVDSAARSLLLAGVVGAGLMLSRTHNVVAQKAAWTLVLAAALLMPALAPWAAHIPGLPKGATIPLPRASWLAKSEPASVQAPSQLNHSWPASADSAALATVPHSAVPEAADSASLSRFPAPAISSGTIRAHNAAPRENPALSLQLADILLLLYGLVCAALLARLGLGIAAAIRLWIRAEPVIHPNIPRELHVRVSDGVASPVTVGSGIVLPAGFAEWDEEKLHIVLAHEASHVRQGDFYLQLCAALYSALFWVSPLGWLLKQKLSELSETISDRAAVNRAASHAIYAQVLLEFAALPRPISTGVAMANHGNVISRIERLLNESSFTQAFAGGRARIAAAVVLVPFALVAATLVRVEAAQAAPPAPPAAPALSPTPGAPEPAAAVAADGLAGNPAAPPIAQAAPSAAPAQSAAAPVPPEAQEASSGTPRYHSTWHSQSHYAYDDHGETYAVISGKDEVTYSDDWHQGQTAEIKKARSMAHGDFLWFTRGGKSYVVDDPQLVAGIKQMYAPMEALGKQQEELGRQQEELGKKQEALGAQMEKASMPTPDMAAQIAAVEKATAALKAAKGQTLTEDKVADMQERLAELQGRLGELQGSIGERQGELGSRQGELGELQGKLGEQQGKLGEQQGRIAQEADKKVKSIIDESLKNGKARPVE
ncbi:MAG TPA: M56 family metallopeptidase [Terracidiphilus sp.]